MMQLVFGDFETYYERGAYSLSKMPSEAYVRDPRFEVIGYAQAVGGADPIWASGHRDTASLLNTIDWPQTIFVAHNTRFDALILYHAFGIRPAMLVDTMSLARACGLGSMGSVSLATLAKTMQSAGISVPNKGTEVTLAAGKRGKDFTAGHLAAYGEYAAKDVAICRTLFDTLKNCVSSDELIYQHHVLASGVYPRIQIDSPTLEAEQARLQEIRTAFVEEAAQLLGIPQERVGEHVRSRDKFRFVLEAFGGAVSREAWSSGSFPSKEGPLHSSYEAYLASLPAPRAFEIPTRLSEAQTKTTGRDVYILDAASTSRQFKALAESEDETLAFLCALKLGLASTIQETRVARFLEIAPLKGIGVPVNISGAHTHRMSGADKLNVQNLPSGRKKGQTDALKQSIRPPRDGYVFVGADASQIEARLNAYISGQNDLLEIFATGGDPYAAMAAHIYGGNAADISEGNKAGDKECKAMRQLGKAAVLGCGYRMGSVRFAETCAAQGIELGEEMAARTVRVYRQVNFMIAQTWSRLDNIGRALVDGERVGYFGGPANDLFFADPTHEIVGSREAGIRLPDGLWVVYPQLRLENRASKFSSEQRPQLLCTRYKGTRPDTVFLHGGVMLENITQALAFCIGKWHLRKMTDLGYEFVLNEHDAWVFLAPHEKAEQATADLKRIMSTCPPWLPNAPLACEAGWGDTLGNIDKK